MAGGSGPFPNTRHSVLESIRSSEPELRRAAFEALVAGYWKPVFKYIRLKWHASPDEAADLTQSFFAKALEKDFFAAFDSSRARFRTFLRTCVDRFVANARKADARLKRGGAVALVPLDFDAAERELQRVAVDQVRDFDQFFQREWLRGLFAEAAARLCRQCDTGRRSIRYRVFERYDLVREEDDRPTYADLARELGVTPTAVTNELAAARREFRSLVLDVLREQCANAEEFAIEARALGHDDF